MTKIRYIALLCLLLAGQSIGAKSMKDLLVSMPDSLAPYLDKNLRLEFAELQEMGVKAEVKNLLGETSVMDTLTADFLQIRLSQASTLQMKRLPGASSGDSLVCVVKTLAAPEKESELYLFSQDWKPLPDAVNLQDFSESLIQKPDTMSEARFLELRAMVEPRMVNALLLPDEDYLVVRLALPLLSAEDKAAVSAIKIQKKLKIHEKRLKSLKI